MGYRSLETSERLYPIRRPTAAFCAGAAVAVFGGLIGLGGAEFRLPVLIAIFEVFPHRAVRINLLISLATLAVSAIARFAFIHSTDVSAFSVEIVAMLAGGAIAAWIGAGLLARIPKRRIIAIIAALLVAIAALLVFESFFAGATDFVFPADHSLRGAVAFTAGLFVGAVSSLLGVAGGELIIPILIFLFGAESQDGRNSESPDQHPGRPHRHRTSLANRSLPFAHHARYLVLPMSAGSVLGAVAGGYLAAWTPNDLLRIGLASVLAVSAVKLVLSRASANRSV